MFSALSKAVRLKKYRSTECPPLEEPLSSNIYQLFSLGDTIARGKFGTVYTAVEQSTNQRFAIKKIESKLHSYRSEYTSKDDFKKSVQEEVTFHKFMQKQGIAVSLHPNTFFVYHDADEPVAYLIMEQATGSLLQLIQRMDKSEMNAPLVVRIEAEVRRLIGAQISSGVVCVDQKPGNILYFGEYSAPSAIKLRLTDFGSAWCCKIGCTTLCSNDDAKETNQVFSKFGTEKREIANQIATEFLCFMIALMYVATMQTYAYPIFSNEVCRLLEYTRTPGEDTFEIAEKLYETNLKIILNHYAKYAFEEAGIIHRSHIYRQDPAFDWGSARWNDIVKTFCDSFGIHEKTCDSLQRAHQ